MKATLFQQGMDLLVFGMGTVFLFLTLTVVCMHVMSKIIAVFFTESEPAPISPKAITTENASRHVHVEPKILAAIQDAIYQHRARK